MVMQGYSAEALYQFLQFAGDKGLLKAATAKSRKLASKRILAVLDAQEAEDLREVDIDAAFHRFQNIEGGKFKPDSLSVYKSRLKAAVEDFLSWRENPSTFKPGFNTKKSRGKPIKKETAAKRARHESQSKPADNQFSKDEEFEVFQIPIPGKPSAIFKVPKELTAQDWDMLKVMLEAYINRLSNDGG